MNNNWNSFLNFKFHEAAGFERVHGNAIIQSWQIDQVQLPTYPDAMYTYLLKNLLDKGVKLKYIDYDKEHTGTQCRKLHPLTRKILEQGLPSNIEIRGRHMRGHSGNDIYVHYKTEILGGVVLLSRLYNDGACPENKNYGRETGSRNFLALPDAMKTLEAWPQPARIIGSRHLSKQ